MKKTTWSEFLKEAKNGIAFCGSTINENIEYVQKAIDKNKDRKFKINRWLVSGSTVLKFKTDKYNDFSFLDKRGKIFKYHNFFIVSDRNIFVVYKIGA